MIVPAASFTVPLNVPSAIFVVVLYTVKLAERLEPVVGAPCHKSVLPTKNVKMATLPVVAVPD